MCLPTSLITLIYASYPPHSLHPTYSLILSTSLPHFLHLTPSSALHQLGPVTHSLHFGHSLILQFTHTCLQFIYTCLLHLTNTSLTYSLHLDIIYTHLLYLTHPLYLIHSDIHLTHSLFPLHSPIISSITHSHLHLDILSPPQLHILFTSLGSLSLPLHTIYSSC